jgi:hypothetical protein
VAHLPVETFVIVQQGFQGAAAAFLEGPQEIWLSVGENPPKIYRSYAAGGGARAPESGRCSHIRIASEFGWQLRNINLNEFYSY